MKLVTDKAHRDYYYKQGFIEFDGLFSESQVTKIKHLVDEVLCKRLSLRKGQLIQQTSNDLFLNGHDLFRDDEMLKKIILHRRLAEIAGELNEIHSLRFGADQLLLGEKKPFEKNTPYEKFLKQEGTLQDKCCFRPAVAGLMICLEPIVSETDHPLFSKVAGSGMFFKPDILLNLAVLDEIPCGRYIMITYVDPRTVYVLNENDPHTHTLKHRGYVFGDRLSEKINPLITR